MSCTLSGGAANRGDSLRGPVITAGERSKRLAGLQPLQQPWEAMVGSAGAGISRPKEKPAMEFEKAHHWESLAIAAGQKTMTCSGYRAAQPPTKGER